MKLGAENRTKLITAMVLMVVAVLLIARFLFSGGESAPSSAAAAPGVAAPQPGPGGRNLVKGGKRVVAGPRSLDPTLRYDWLNASEETKYEGKGRNIFRAEIDIPKVSAPVVTDAHPTPQQPVGPPPPPPINLKFFGYSNRSGEARKVFLEKGDDIFVAREGDIIDRRYRILRITPNAVEVEDVLNNNRQSIPLSQG